MSKKRTVRKREPGYSWDIVRKDLAEFLKKLTLANSPFVRCFDSEIESIPFSTYIVFEAGWAAETTVTIRYHISEGCRSVKIETVVGWSSTHRSVSQATAALAMYHRAVEFAAIVESKFPDEYWLKESDSE